MKNWFQPAGESSNTVAQKSSKPRRRRGGYRPMLEGLEDRCLLSTLSFSPSTSALPMATAGVPYLNSSQEATPFTVSGDSNPDATYSFTVQTTAGIQPLTGPGVNVDGLQFQQRGHATSDQDFNGLPPDFYLVGTPAQVGTYSFTVSVTNSDGYFGSQLYTLPVGLGLVPTTPIAAVAGTSYSQTFNAIGGSGNYTYNIVTKDFNDTDGLKLVNGVLSGKPNAITNGSSVNTTSNNDVTASGMQTITPASMTGITAGLTLYADPGGENQEKVTVSSVSSDDTSFMATFKYKHGTNFVLAQFPFTIDGTDTANNSITTSTTYALNVASSPFTMMAAPTPPAATVGSSGLALPVFTVSGGSGGYSLDSQEYPDGLYLSVNPTTGAGTLNSVNTTSSTLVAPGSVPVTPASMQGIAVGVMLVVDTGASQETVTVSSVTNSSFTATFTNTHTGTYSIISQVYNVTGGFRFNAVVQDSFGDQLAMPFLLAVSGAAGSPLILFANSGTSLPVGTAQASYLASFTAVGGTGTYSFALVNGSGAPLANVDGVPLTSPSNGNFTLSGTPASAGTFPFSISVTDSTMPSPNTVTEPYTLTVNPGNSITIMPAFLPAATQGVDYAQTVPDPSTNPSKTNSNIREPFQFTATGGSGSGYTYSVTGLPPGMGFTSTGVLVGAPAIARSYNISVTATSGSVTSPPQPYTLTVLPAPPNFLTSALFQQAYGINKIMLPGGVTGNGAGQTIGIYEDKGDNPFFSSSYTVNTTTTTQVTASEVTAGKPVPITPASMAGITTGLPLVVDTGANQETVIPTVSSDGKTFTAIFTKAHTSASYPIVFNSYSSSDLAKFDQYFGIPDFGNQPGLPVFLKLDGSGGTSYGTTITTDVGEFTQDIEWIHAVAPMANIVVFENAPKSYIVNWTESDLPSALLAALNVSIAPVTVVSDSIGEAESPSLVDDSQFIPDAGHPNVTYVASSGDVGQNGETPGLYYPAGSPNVLAAGESKLVTDALGNYLGEMGMVGTGAGVSTLETIPPYQQQDPAVAQYSTMFRTTPDVDSDGGTYTAIYNSDQSPQSANPVWEAGGGTSLAAPTWAALVAIADQGRSLVSTTGQSTTSNTAVTIPTGAASTTATITPVSMQGINAGSTLQVDTGSNQEYVTVISVTGTTFTATFYLSHTTTPFAITPVLSPLASYSALTGTTSTTAVNAAGSVPITPLSMQGISFGSLLVVDSNEGNTTHQEVVRVTALTQTTFTATFAQTHSTSLSPLSIVPLTSLSANDIHSALYYLAQTSPNDFHYIANMDDGTMNAPGYNLHTGLGSPVANLLVPDLVNVNNSPVITSANSTTFIVGTSGSFTIAASNFPPPISFSESGTLPTGVTLNPSTGVLSGIPAAGTAGTYSLVLTVTNSAGSSTQSFTLTVDQAPAITSANATTFTVGSTGTFTVTATGFPAPTLSESGALPNGVSFTAATGVLSGMPAAGTGGTYALTFSASNGVGSAATQSFTLTVDQAPAITSANNTTFTVGSAGTFTVTATGFPTPALSESGNLPSSVSFNAGIGVLSGIPAAGSGGTYPLTFTAANGVGSNVTQSFTLTVNQAPAITSATSTTFTIGSAGSFTVTATGFPAPSLSESGALPTGVTFNAGTGLLSGMPAAGTSGTYPLTFTASNGVGTSAMQSFTLTVNPAPGTPSITSFAPAAGPIGSQVVLNGTNFSTVSGVTFNGLAAPSFMILSATQLIATVPTGATSGPITVTNPIAQATSASSFSVNTQAAVPVIAAFAPGSGPVGSQVVLYGANLSLTNTISFAGPNSTRIATKNFTVLSPTQVIVTVPTGAVSGVIGLAAAGHVVGSNGNFIVTTQTAVPVIAAFAPGSGPVGSQVVLYGANLGLTNTISFAGPNSTRIATKNFTVLSPTLVIVTVPAGSVSGIIGLAAAGHVVGSNGNFNVTTQTAAPVIATFSPGSGPVKSQVVLYGANLALTSSITFAAADGSRIATKNFMFVSPAEVIVTVPTGAVSGIITLTVNGIVASSSSAFVVNSTQTAVPVIAAFQPASGPVGSQVLLFGANLGRTSTITFAGPNGSRIAVTSIFVLSPTEVYVTVPDGAVSGILSLTANGIVVSSSNSFVVTGTSAPQASPSFTPVAGLTSATDVPALPQNLSANRAVPTSEALDAYFAEDPSFGLVLPGPKNPVKAV